MVKGKRLADSLVEDVRTRAAADLLPILESHGLQLRAQGRDSFMACCPFHEERTPSFHVTPSKGSYFCFGCGASGDAISYLQETEGRDFREVIEQLADKYGLHYETTEDDGRGVLRAVLTEAQRFFTDGLLNTPDGEIARRFLQEREFDLEEAAQRFGCGYAPKGSYVLLAHLRRQGFTDQQVIDAGLAKRGQDNNKPWDFFRNRLTWSITAANGYTVGFAARRIDPNDTHPAKYINSPETLLYKKSQVLYGVWDARRAIAKERRVIIVEGYTDVMSMQLAGIDNTVATCGTAFTPEHLALIKGIIGADGEITAAFDADEAGAKAATTLYDLAHTTIPKLTVMRPPRGMDPDEVRRTQGPEALRAIATKKTPLIGALIEWTIQRAPHDTPEERVAALDSIKPLLSHVTDPLIAAQYAKSVANQLHLSEEQVEARLLPRLEPHRPAPSAPSPHLSKGRAMERLEREIVAVCAHDRRTAAMFAAELGWLARLDITVQLGKLIEQALALGPQGEDWFNAVCEVAARSGQADAYEALQSLASFDPEVPAEALPDHVKELLRRLEEAQGQADVAALITEMQHASPERRATISRILEQDMQARRARRTP